MCYRESNEEDLEAFAREVEEAGRMNEERRQMFKQLENPQPPAQQDGNRPSVSRYIGYRHMHTHTLCTHTHMHIHTHTHARAHTHTH